MNAQAIASLPPETLPAPPRAPDAGTGSSFVALLTQTSAPSASAESEHGIAATVRADGRAAVARAHRAAASDKQTTDGSGGVSAGVIAAPPAQQSPSSASATATPAPASTATAPTTPSTATLAALLLATAPATGATPYPSTAANAATAALANSSNAADTAAPSAATAPSASSAGAVAFAAMAAELGVRIAAGAPTLTSQPRVALADLAASQDKLAAAAAPAVNHSALSLEALQGLAKSPTPAGATIDEKALAEAAKDVAVAATSLDRAGSEGTSNQQPGATAVAGTSPSIDAPATTAIAPPPPAPIATAPAPLSPTMLRAAEQVALVLPQVVKSGDNHIQIQLQPAELGGIDVKLSVNHDGRVTMVVSADRSDTLNLLRQDSGSLTQALRDAGLQADNSSLSFNLRGGFSFNQQAFQGGAAGGSAPSAAGHDLSDIALPAATQRRHAGSLDIHV